MPDCDKILIVDDDAVDRLTLSRALRRNGIAEIDEVTSGEQAVVYVSMLQYGQQPNLIFVDLTLEGMSGLELIRWLRQNSIFDHVPVVVLTGSRTEEHRSTAIALRAKAYFIKPTKVEELDAIVQEALEHCREETF